MLSQKQAKSASNLLEYGQSPPPPIQLINWSSSRQQQLQLQRPFWKVTDYGTPPRPGWPGRGLPTNC